MEPTYHEGKFTELLLYVAGRLGDDRAGGATKLNKVLFFADFAHTRKHGRPITGAEYQKLRNGPAPRRLVPVRARLIEMGEAEIVRDEFLGYELHRLVPRREADVSVFDVDELTTIDAVLAGLGPMTATQVSQLSHDEPWWPLYDEGDQIPYHAALLPKRQVVTAGARRMAEDVAHRYGLQVER